MTGLGGSAGPIFDESGTSGSAQPTLNRAPQDPVQDYKQTLRLTYLYLRSSLVVVVIAIFLAVAFTPDGFKPAGDVVLPSISAYYYTPARIVFTGALWAAALALLAISGRGVQTYLLDLAAVFAPLIAIVPTRVEPSELGEEAALGDCVAGWTEKFKENPGCIPEDHLGYASVGFKVWLCLAVVGLLFFLVQGIFRRRKLGEWKPLSYWGVLGAGVVTLAVYTLLWWSPWSEIDQEGLQLWAHVLAASVFFGIIAAVAVIEAVKQLRGDYETQPFLLSRKAYGRIYLITGAVLSLDIVFAAVIVIIAPPGGWVFGVETVGLITFAIFWAVQTVEHWRDANSWESPEPSSIRRTEQAA